MAGYRQTTWIKRLEPIASHIFRELKTIMQGKTDEELDQLEKDLKNPNDHNCWYMVFLTKDIVGRAVEQEKLARSNKEKNAKVAATTGD